jgi:TM2 domain-containing membrane protein YozV
MTVEVCPYCRSPLLAEEPVTECEGCGTRHHTDCFEENGGCTIFGCAKAPVDEPKMTISGPDLVSAARAIPSATGVAAAAQPAIAPPPRLGVDPPPPVDASAQSLESVRRAYSNVVPSMFSIYGPGDEAAGAETAPEIPSDPKSRTTFILLGALLGAFGAHNFYAGYTKKAVWQLVITLVSFGFASPMSWIWAIIDICTVNEDNRGVQFES